MLRWIENALGITARRNKKNIERARAGETTGGYLNPGERDRMFRLGKQKMHPSNRPRRRQWRG